jgi:hypothetical protein
MIYEKITGSVRPGGNLSVRIKECNWSRAKHWTGVKKSGTHVIIGMLIAWIPDPLSVEAIFVFSVDQPSSAGDHL